MKLLLLQTCLVGLAFCEWIEITKVGNTRAATQGEPNYTPATYEITLDKPQIDNVTEVVGKEEERATTTPFLVGNVSQYPQNSSLDGDDDDEYIITIEDQPSTTTLVERTVETNDDDGDESKYENQNDLLTMAKHVQNELLDFKGRSLGAKLDRLKALRDDILHEIKFRISRLFKPPENGGSDSRLYKDESHMDYPSNEGTLMTIGFLTFAVFLIKLVLKLIYAYKMKQQQQYYQTTAPPVGIFLKNADHGIDPESARALRYLDEYSPHH